MYEKLEAENAELKKRDTESQKRDMEAQKMTQDMLEKLQDRAGNAEEKSEMYENLTYPCNKGSSTNLFLALLNTKHENDLVTTTLKYTIELKKVFRRGKPISEGIYFFNTRNTTCESNMQKCSICENNQAKYAYKKDRNCFPFKIEKISTDKERHVIGNDPDSTIFFLSWIKTLCKDCIQNLKLKDTIYVESPPTVDLSSSTSTSAHPVMSSGGKNASLLKFLERKEVTGTLNPQQKLQLSGLRSDLV